MMRRYRSGSEDDAERSAERIEEAHQLDMALAAMGSKFSAGYALRLTVLDDAISDFVDGLRGDDVGPAQVLITFKEHLAAIPASSADLDAFAIRRCIARYYEA